MSDGIDLKGFADLDRALGEMPNRMAGARLTRAVAAGAAVIRKEARLRAPKHAGPYEDEARKDRRPGTLKRSIIARVDRKYRDGVSYAIGWSKKVFWGRFMEFGTVSRGGKSRNIAPRPFMRPAFDTKVGEAIKVMGERLGEEVVKAFKSARVE